MTLAPPRKSGEREENGRLKRSAGANNAGPTPELAMYKAQKARRVHIPEHMEPKYAESTIGILEARGMISVDQAKMCNELVDVWAALGFIAKPKGGNMEGGVKATGGDAGESAWLRKNVAAYKAATADMQVSDRRLFEHVIIRNNEREWMKLADSSLFGSSEWNGQNCYPRFKTTAICPVL